MFKYTRKDVNYEEPLKIFVRGSSAKERIDNKEKMIVFIIHEQSMYTWTKESFCGESDDDENYIEECIAQNPTNEIRDWDKDWKKDFNSNKIYIDTNSGALINREEKKKLFKFECNVTSSSFEI